MKQLYNLLLVLLLATTPAPTTTTEAHTKTTPKHTTPTPAPATQAPTPVPESPHGHPIYTYTCNENLTVTFKGVNGNVSYFGKHMPDGCKITKGNANHEGYFLINKNCFLNKDISTEREVSVLVHDANEKEHSPTPTQSATGFSPKPIIGGRHIFKLRCNPIPDVGVIRYALGETGVKDVAVLKPKTNQVAGVDMFLKEGDDMKLPDISEVYIGDMFFMYLQYNGGESYEILPESCSANSGNWRLKTPNVELWKQSTSSPCLSKDATNYNIMDSFIRDDPKIVHAKFHGFRFAAQPDEAGDNDVTITCVVKICKTNGCTDHCNVTPKPISGGRGRRQINSDPVTQTVSRQIKVKDRRSNSGGQNQLNMMLFFLIGVITYLNGLR